MQGQLAALFLDSNKCLFLRMTPLPNLLTIAIATNIQVALNNVRSYS